MRRLCLTEAIAGCQLPWRPKGAASQAGMGERPDFHPASRRCWHAPQEPAQEGQSSPKTVWLSCKYLGASVVVRPDMCWYVGCLL